MHPEESSKAREGMEGMSYKEQLRTLGLSHLERRRLRDNFIALCSFMRRGHGDGGADLSSLGSSHGTRGNGSKLCQGRFRLDVRKHSFTRRVVRCWNRLPRERRSMPQACRRSKGVWAMPFPTCCNLVSPAVARQLD